MDLKRLGIDDKHVHIYDEIDSTNLEAVRRAREIAPLDIEIFLARRQTAGRGRLGKSFVSEGGAGIYLSILIPAEKYREGALTAHTAVAVATALDNHLGIRTRIKWVNDIYLSGKKLGGILVEAVTSTEGKIVAFVVGLGINVYKNAITDEISDIATSLEDCDVFVESADELCEKIIESFLTLLCEPSPKTLLSEYRKRALRCGARIEVLPIGGEPYEATVLGVNDDFTLKVQLADGRVCSLSSGEVKTTLKTALI